MMSFTVENSIYWCQFYAKMGVAMLQSIAEKNRWPKFITIQSEYSLLYREEEREMIPYCNYNGIGNIPWGPVAFGWLCRPVGETSVRAKSWDASDTDKTTVSCVEELAKKRGKSMAQIALAWTSSNCTSPVVGISSVTCLEESILGDFVLSAEDKKYLEEPYVAISVRHHQ